MLNLKIDKNLKIIYSVWIFVVLGSLVLLYSLPFVLGVEGDYIDSWVISGGSSATTDGINIWVQDGNTIFKYYMDGTEISSWAITGGVTLAGAIATDGNYIWIAEWWNDEVYKFNMDGTYADEYWALAAGNTEPIGMTTDGNSIWVLDRSGRKIYEYDMYGNPLGSWSPSDMLSNNIIMDITTYGNYIWVVDYYHYLVYKYHIDGTYLGSWGLTGGNSKAWGITTDGDYFFVVDNLDRRVYRYEGPVSCTCPGSGNNWVINMADKCTITSNCDLGAGTLSFTGAGWCKCDATIDTVNLGDPGSGGTLYIDNNCIIYVN